VAIRHNPGANEDAESNNKELSRAPQFEFLLKGTCYSLYVRMSDNPRHDYMLWFETWFSEAFKTPKPRWVSEAITKFSYDRVVGVQRSGPRTDWRRNAIWMVRVYHWQREGHGLKAACEKLSEELKAKGEFVPWKTIRSACERAKKRFEVRCRLYDGRNLKCDNGHELAARLILNVLRMNPLPNDVVPRMT
jgi:hypothetical protein